jgi:asparagine synthase (glutamine-hydrolysing)
VLLANNLVGGCSLLRGVRRLGAGNRLEWYQGAGPSERPEYRPPAVSSRSGQLLKPEVERIDSALTSAVRRHAPPAEPHALLLSGGRDSRMLAAYLRRVGTSTVALTLGVRGEDDARLARRVARVLDMPLSMAEVSDERFVEYAETQARWEHLANGFSGAAGWGYFSLLGHLPPRVVAGYLCDAIVGGSHIGWAYGAPGGPASFASFFSKMNAWAVGPDVLRRLLRPEVFEAGLVDQVAQRIRNDYESQSAWCFDLANRQRFHVGSQAWRLSFGAWPVLPAADRHVVDAAGSASVALLADRVLQDALLIERFPRLAAIPLAGAPWPGALRPSPLELGRHALSRVRQRVRSNHSSGDQRYVRIYDFNGPGWRAVRRSAEQHRELAHQFFDERALAELLPPPDASPKYTDTIVGPAGAKLLLGFMLWAGRRAA